MKAVYLQQIMSKPGVVKHCAALCAACGCEVFKWRQPKQGYRTTWAVAQAPRGTFQSHPSPITPHATQLPQASIPNPQRTATRNLNNP